MNDHHRCPECKGYETERVHVEWFKDMVEETRICNSCPIQFTNRYSLFEQKNDEVDYE